jgi:hypothetical protein
LNHLVGQDPRRVKQRIHPVLVFEDCRNAAVTVGGTEPVRKIGKVRFDTSAVMDREGTGAPPVREAVPAA